MSQPLPLTSQMSKLRLREGSVCWGQQLVYGGTRIQVLQQGTLPGVSTTWTFCASHTGA